MMHLEILQAISEALSSLNLDESHGCIVIYVGIVKSRVNNKKVRKLKLRLVNEYSLREIKPNNSSMSTSIWISRKSELRPGEPIVVIAVSSSTRDLAFRAARELVEEYKRKIVKVEEYDD